MNIEYVPPSRRRQSFAGLCLVQQITRLLEHFPEREFILVADSGELDVEVYRGIKGRFGDRVREIWIRDVVNDELVNQFRVDGVSATKPESFFAQLRSITKSWP
jgi:phosphatidate phosphatase APP1